MAKMRKIVIESDLELNYEIRIGHGCKGGEFEYLALTDESAKARKREYYDKNRDRINALARKRYEYSDKHQEVLYQERKYIELTPSTTMKDVMDAYKEYINSMEY